jgi:hypothetical protein
MTLEQYYYIGQLIAAGALVISLVYVGLQVKLSTKANQAGAAHAYVDTMNGYVGLINSSPNLAAVMHRGATGLENLTEGEVIQFSAFHDQCFITFEAFYFEWKQGLLMPELWNTYKHALLALLMQPGQREWWGLRRHWYDEEFRSYVEEIVEKGSSIPMHFRAVEAPD